IRYVCDYFIKCHPEDEVYYYQVGDPGADHSWWGPAELVETRMDRPSYKVTASSPGSCVTGETAAALASASIIFKDVDKDYSDILLEHAKSLYAFADKYKSDSGYTAANGFYTSNSGFYDELSWAAAWLYLATNDKDYLKKAEEAYKNSNQNTTWALCWDDVHLGAALLLARETGNKTYTDDLSAHLDYWTTGNNGQKINYSPKGLAWLDNWGSLRYATTTAFLASVYSQSDLCPAAKKDTYWNFAVSQADYALGSSGRSFMIGFGENSPVNPHHRTAQGSYTADMNTPAYERHLLVGALVGGPDAGDNYEDVVSDYSKNEVACDYNAGFTALLAKLYSVYHGQTIKNLGAVETPEDEFFSEAQVNVPGEDFVEIKAYVYNESGWPARNAKDLELRYFVDLSEVYDGGGDASSIEITTNYIQGADSVGLYAWDEESHIYYVGIGFEDGAVYPGGQEYYRKEVQFRMRNTKGTWDNSNDFSYEGLTQNSLIVGSKLALYENDELVYGSEPEAGEHAGASVGNFDITPGGQNGQNGQNDQNGQNGQNGQGSSVATTAKKGDLEITAEYTQSGKNANSLSGNIYVKNTGSGVVSLKDLKLYYYLTNEDGKDLTFTCYYSGIQGDGGKYSGVSGCGGELSKTDKNDSDTLCTISFTDNLGLEKGDTLTISFCINHTDWSTLDTTDDYSAKSAENIEIEF
ncbi:MAG: glycoside hydrolase family 9 protein, partial [Lachnospiraceae bacterium]|nr:glycoside hydrolase family 9 protein [Lachnospiraceae bacterium]